MSKILSRTFVTLFLVTVCQLTRAEATSGGSDGLVPVPPPSYSDAVMDWIGETICFNYSKGARSCFKVGGVTEKANVVSGPTPIPKSSQFPIPKYAYNYIIHLDGADAPSLQFRDGRWSVDLTPVSAPSLQHSYR